METAGGTSNTPSTTRNDTSAAETKGETLFRLVHEKERQLNYQKSLLLTSQEELESLEALIEAEDDPEEKADLLEIVKRFALATKGKKEQFLAMHREWKTALFKLDADLQQQIDA